MKPTRIGALVLTALAVPGGAALAADTDTFRGHTEGAYFGDDGLRPARISFERTGGAVRRVRLEIRVRCPSGQHRSRVVKTRVPIPVGDDGRFSYAVAATGSTGYRSTTLIKGRIRGDRASGVARFAETLDSHGRPSSSGRLCSSDDVDWSAVA